MAKKIVWIVVSCLMVLSLVIASCGPKEEAVKEEPVKEEPVKEEPVKEEPVQKEEVVVPGKEVPWWETKWGKPQYGGTITQRLYSDITTFDSYYGTSGLWGLDSLFVYDTAVSEEDMERHKLLGGGPTRGWMAESWEKTDPLTWVVHLRKGIRWQNKPPVNGREFTAYDVEYHFHRIFGLGKYGFTQPSPYVSVNKNLVAVDALDKYTLQYKFVEETLGNEGALSGGFQRRFCASKEAVDLWKDTNDWKRVISTGAYMIKDYVTSSAIIYEKNPNYWWNDPRYPEYQAGYADVVVGLLIPDMSTAISAMRTGKIDILGGVMGSGLTWEQTAQLKKSNPELIQEYLLDSGGGICMRVNKAPFTDIRVRKAMQMAMDLKTLAATHYGGIVDGTPYGLIGPYQKDHIVPYQEWTQELKDAFAYNPEGAKKLLAEAGYPNGFKTNIVASSGGDLDLLLIVKNWLLNIGVDMEIKTMDAVAYGTYVRGGKDDQMNAYGMTGMNGGWGGCYLWSTSTFILNCTSNNDPQFDALYNTARLAKTEEEAQRLCREMCLYDLSHHWRIYLQPRAIGTAYHPWLKGYWGEILHFDAMYMYINYWWVDRDMKKSMGY